MKTLMTSCYLIVGAKLNNDASYTIGKPSIRLSKLKPKVESHEIAVEINLQIPLSLFRKPQLSASITIPDDQAPSEISAEVQDNIVEAIREASGMNVNLTVYPAEVKE